MNSRSIAHITIQEILDKYSVVLLDSYGVLIREFGLVNGAKTLVNSLIDAKKPFFVLTNDGSLLPKNTTLKYQNLGLNINHSNIITSGCALKLFFKENSLIGANCVILGTNDTIKHVENAGGNHVLPDSNFEILIIGDQSGFQFTTTINSIINSIFHKLNNEEFINIILLNPDIIFPMKINTWAYGPATIAIMIEEAIKYKFPKQNNYKLYCIGKPYKYLFDMVFNIYPTYNMVMLGDQILTDIKGANEFGIDSVLINPQIPIDQLQELEKNLIPNFIMDL